ncbi:alginate lyase family protein [Parapedobacter sp. 10938]|uniref:alginate lyase family protein n=1 Tax=Parapedobacter flavus TaxID=3110225 RepID=UPI002DBD9E2D|nr:alginate lyase family protein [Parapedobacter sp. 10938]MEC3880170.1 alginate lyase family protein [Parapedobacter sp. 10938]
MFSKLKTVFNTIKYLKFTQILHQVKYRLISPKTLKSYKGTRSVGFEPLLNFTMYPAVVSCWDGRAAFTFLNLRVDFEEGVDWDFQQHGKLWNYNLQYANYLLQPDVPNGAKIKVIKSQYEWLIDGRLTLEPYPASLRIINSIRWIVENQVDDSELLHYLYADLKFLSSRLEYHLLGNHIMENAFALMMGGAFFGYGPWLTTGGKTLKKELSEQIMPDGAHFELSPMYHKIIFFRILELIDWYSSWPNHDQNFRRYLEQKASDMYAWLSNITFRNGDIPHFNDSANAIAFPAKWLMRYADQLGITASRKVLYESGYRSVTKGEYELKIDFAQLGPAYQPGHAHADALSFILHFKNEPVFVEQGTSTYQVGTRRDLERSTQAHNTVVVNNANQSQVWGGFRVAQRARTTILKDAVDGVYAAMHDGYRRFGVNHTRSFSIEPSKIVITDTLTKSVNATSYLHLYPNVDIHEVLLDAILLTNGVKIVVEGADSVIVEEYDFAEGYNVYRQAKRIAIPFTQHLKSLIYFEEQLIN